MLLETELDGDLIREFIYSGGQRVARRDADGTVYYLFPDRLGSVRVMTNATGNTVWSATYLPFGDAQRIIVSNVDNLYRFADMEYDTESGLYQTLFRKYAPNLARWLGADPVGGYISAPQSLNRYGYVVHNPTSLSDPLGNVSWRD